jgi:hypothetical protein
VRHLPPQNHLYGERDRHVALRRVSAGQYAGTIACFVPPKDKLSNEELMKMRVREANAHAASQTAGPLHPVGSAFLRVIIETHDSKLEMDTRCGTARYIEARAVESIRAGFVGILIASPNTEVRHGGPDVSK